MASAQCKKAISGVRAPVEVTLAIFKPTVCTSHQDVHEALQRIQKHDYLQVSLCLL